MEAWGGLKIATAALIAVVAIPGVAQARCGGANGYCHYRYASAQQVAEEDRAEYQSLLASLPPDRATVFEAREKRMKASLAERREWVDTVSLERDRAWWWAMVNGFGGFALGAALSLLFAAAWRKL